MILSRPLVETLEGRRLMAVSPLPDLSITFGSLPSGIVSARRTKLVVNVSNVGDGVAKGKAAIHLTGDGAALTGETVSLHLKPGSHKSFALHFVLPDSRNDSGGPYLYGGPTGVPVNLAATVEAEGKLADQDDANNTATANQVPVYAVSYMRSLANGNPGNNSFWGDL